VNELVEKFAVIYGRVHYLIHNSLLLVPVTSQRNPAQNFTSYSLYMLFNIISFLQPSLPTFYIYVRLEVLTAVTMKNVVCWDIKSSSYLTGDTLRLHYTDKLINAM
jgi:hypothetical protein